MKWLVVFLLVAVGAIVFGGYVLAVEEPSFQTVERDGAFEIRDYPALCIAQTTASGDQKQAASEGFRRLAGYIFGANHTRKRIAMTAPVTQEPQGEKIAMTAPVTQTRHADSWVVRFTMPKGYTLATLPAPDDPRVTLRETPPVRMAVMRFSGYAQPDVVEGKMSTLRAWIKRKGLTATGPASLAQYNPPWTLWFLRRNEVMIPVER